MADTPENFSLRQQTVAATAEFAGPGLHSGRNTQVKVHPAPVGHGIVFRQTRRRGGAIELAASWRHRVPYPRCTALRSPDGTIFRTVEHLMAALYALQIDNALVEMDSYEIPILDGSAAPILTALANAGIEPQAAARQFIRVLRPISIVDGKASVAIEPADGFSIDCNLELPHQKPQTWSGPITPEAFCRSFPSARTYGVVDRLWPAILLGKLWLLPVLRGASLNNALVLYRGRLLNPSGLRFADEFVRHKILDLVGDMYLAGAPLLGHLKINCSGHRHNWLLLKTLFETPGAFEHCSFAPSS